MPQFKQRSASSAKKATSQKLAKQRAIILRDLKTGRRSPGQILIKPSLAARGLRVSTVMRQAQGIGPASARRVVDATGLDLETKIDDLSADERKALVLEFKALDRERPLTRGRGYSKRRASAAKAKPKAKKASTARDPSRVLRREWKRLVGEEQADPAAIERAVRIAAAEQSWRAGLGTLLSKDDVTKLLAADAKRLRRLQQRRELIVLPTRDGEDRYPAFQFQDGEPSPPLAHAHELMVERGHVSPWTAASWARTSHPELDGLSPSQWTGNHRDEKRLIQVTERDADRLSQ